MGAVRRFDDNGMPMLVSEAPRSDEVAGLFDEAATLPDASIDALRGLVLSRLGREATDSELIRLHDAVRARRSYDEAVDPGRPAPTMDVPTRASERWVRDNASELTLEQLHDLLDRFAGVTSKGRARAVLEELNRRHGLTTTEETDDGEG